MTEELPANALSHLHDEAFLAPFLTRPVGWRDMLFVGGREPISLDGSWRFCLDLFDTGLRQRWFEIGPPEPDGRPFPLDYDPYDGDVLAVPSCWTMARPEWLYFEGSAWYTRGIVDPRATGAAQADDRIVLRVGAANYQATLFLDGAYLGHHDGGSTPFFVDLTDRLAGREHRLQIRVNNARDGRRVPMYHFDWWNHGGIYREVALYAVPPVYVRDVVTQLTTGRLDAVTVRITTSEPSPEPARLQIDALGVDVAVDVSTGTGTADLEVAPSLWSPDDPVLYDLSVTLGRDRVADRVGFREIRVDGTRILLNGAPIKLRGVCVHEDDAVRGKVTDAHDIRRRFAHAKELGCNFLRLAHYPHHELAAELADAEGLLLWAEIPVYWSIAFDQPGTLADAENQLRELIRRDRNRASVIAWGIGNENADTDARLAFMRHLAQAARDADPTRLVGAACLVDKTEKRIDDRLAADLDLVGINEYYGWYDRRHRYPAGHRPQLKDGQAGGDHRDGRRRAGGGCASEDGALFSEERIWPKSIAASSQRHRADGECARAGAVDPVRFPVGPAPERASRTASTARV